MSGNVCVGDRKCMETVLATKIFLCMMYVHMFVCKGVNVWRGLEDSLRYWSLPSTLSFSKIFFFLVGAGNQIWILWKS